MLALHAPTTAVKILLELPRVTEQVHVCCPGSADDDLMQLDKDCLTSFMG